MNKATIDPAYGNNTKSMDEFIDSIATVYESGHLDHIAVYGYASPDGPFALNDKLALQRCNAIAQYVSRNAGIPMNEIHTSPRGVAWDGLRELVTENMRTPSRDAVLRILDKYLPEASTDQAVSDQCRKSLLALNGGRSYRWMLHNLFPKLRYSIVMYTTSANDRNIGQCSIGVMPDEPTPTTTDDVLPQPPKPDVAPATAAVDEQADIVAASSTPTHYNPLIYKPIHRLALKTNLIYDALLLPNIEVEYRVNRNWSVALEGGVAWWGRYSKNRSYRLAMVSPEARYWINPRAPWHGFYVGAFAGGGLYDFLKDDSGYRGEGVMGGLSVGYMWPVSRCLSLEAEIGGGYLYSQYKEYRPLDGHHVYRRTKDLNYFGPLKVKFSLVWRLWDVNKPRKKVELQ
ncbi:MAG: DUF3575 domain-containing protein [Muribaculaceae bacterium]|nr:DUF3575 domain-containing protein [Muribaculaceae bacterium]MDE6321300.1 DUF3575 domain-containing protein [Muribaculaceae bacterium]